jgi:peptidoglycan/LPS O-acetylase OafA/YrhL
VYSSNPDHAANGSLWTLPVEVRAYIVLAVVGFGLRAPRRTISAALIGATAASLFAANIVGDLGHPSRLTSLFVASSVLYLLRDSIVLRLDVAAALLLVWLAAFATPFATAAGMLTLPYLMACAAYCTPHGLRRFVLKGDVSYGIYLYAFPIQQSVVALLGPIPPVALAGIAAPLAWLAGFASWRLVERPILRWRGRTPARGLPTSETSDRPRPAPAVV